MSVCQCTIRCKKWGKKEGPKDAYAHRGMCAECDDCRSKDRVRFAAKEGAGGRDGEPEREGDPNILIGVPKSIGGTEGVGREGAGRGEGVMDAGAY